MSAILQSGDSVGGFRIVRALAAGGMAVVYEAEQVSLGRKVALKVIAAELADREEFRLRFDREGKHVATLHHPNIVPVYHAGNEDGHLFIAMQLMEGGTLQQLLSKGPLDAERFAEVFLPISDALDHAHQRGIVHRDVKPGNILFDGDGRPYLADFGIARSIADAPALTVTGGFLGSLQYASPEQVRGEAVSTSSDIYSLAAVEFHALYGESPSHGDSHADQSLVERALAKGMSERPDDRWPSATELTATVIEAHSATNSTSEQTGHVDETVTPTTSLLESDRSPTAETEVSPAPAEAVSAPEGQTTRPLAGGNETILVDRTTVETGARGNKPESRVEKSDVDEQKRGSLTKWVLVGSLAVAMIVAAVSFGILTNSSEGGAPAEDKVAATSGTTTLTFSVDQDGLGYRHQEAPTGWLQLVFVNNDRSGASHRMSVTGGTYDQLSTPSVKPGESASLSLEAFTPVVFDVSVPGEDLTKFRGSVKVTDEYR